MKYYKVIKRESKTGINLRVKPANHQHPFGFVELGGSIQANDLDQATAVFKAIIKNALIEAGFTYAAHL